MREEYFVSLDLGTSFIKAAVFDEDGACRGISHVPVKSTMEGPGTYIQKAEDLLESVLECLRQAVKNCGHKICAIAFTGQMAGFMGVDKNWNDITTWSCSLDTRYVPYANRQMEKLSEEFWEISGTNAPLMAPKCEWFQKEYPEKAKHIAKYMMISGYVIGRLGNMKIEDATIDSSYITWTGLSDVKTKTWSKELCEKAGVSIEKLPRIVNSYEVCGYLSEEMAAFAGLRAKIPLVSGAGDKIAGCIGAAVLETGDMIFEASSYGAVSTVIDRFISGNSDKNYDVIPALTEGKYYAHKYIPGSGITLQWFKEHFAGSLSKEEVTFREIDDKIKDIPPGCEGLMGLGLLGGSAMPFDGELKGAFVGHTWIHRPEHFYRALLEGYGYEIALTIDEIERVYGSREGRAVKMIGGGAKSNVWPQIMADICGREFQCLDKEDIALWGTAVIAGYGVGKYENLEKIAKKNTTIVKTYHPDMKKHRVYQQYKTIYEKMRKEFHIYCKMLKSVR